MKKCFLTAAVFAAAFTTAWAGGFDIQFNGGLSTFYQPPCDAGEYTARAYIYISPDIASRLAGNRLTGISFSAASEGVLETTGTVFVSENLDAEPVASAGVNVVYSSMEVNEITEGVFATPYTIKQGQGFYMGYTVDKCNEYIYPLGVGDGSADQFAGYADVIVDGEVCSTVDLRKTIGSNLFIKGVTVGNVETLENMVSLGSVSLPNFTLPVYEANGSKPKLSVSLDNIGSNRIESVEYSITANGTTVEPQKATMIIASGNKVSRSFYLPELAEGRNVVKFHLSKVNDVPVDLVGEVACFMLDAGRMVPRKFVVEKATGTWCAYCPVGIVGFEDMEKNHPEEFVGIDLHHNDEFSVDNAEVSGFITDFSDNLIPKAIVNRDFRFCFSPSTVVLESNFNTWQTKSKGVASVDLSVEAAEGKLIATASPTFRFSQNDADYSIAYVLLENGLEGVQQNNYAGSAGAPGNWGSYKDKQPWTYMHTVRSYTNLYGVPGSVPSVIEKDTPYPFTAELSTDVLKDTAQSYVIALLIDNPTGVVLNAARVEAKDYAGVDAPVVDDDAGGPVEYYNLQGFRVDKPRQGQLLIRRQGLDVKKVVM